MTHPGELDVLDFALGRGGLEQRDELRAHLASCGECSPLLSIAGRLSGWPSTAMPRRYDVRVLPVPRPRRTGKLAAALAALVLLIARGSEPAPRITKPPPAAAVGEAPAEALVPPEPPPAVEVESRDRNRDGRVDVADAMLAAREGRVREARAIVVERLGR